MILAEQSLYLIGIYQGLLQALKDMIERQGLYLQSALTLSQLASESGLPSHYISQVINELEGKNFYQFINQYRIEHACQLLKQDARLKILEVAMASGFNSKSAFNPVFKQFTGQTPSSFRRQAC